MSLTKFYLVTLTHSKLGHVIKVWLLYHLCERNYHISNFSNDLSRKTDFFKGQSRFKFNNLGLVLDIVAVKLKCLMSNIPYSLNLICE